MSWSQAIIVYMVCWWLLLLMALPFGVHAPEYIQAGESRAAPQRTHLWVKCAMVTFLAVIVTWGIDLLVGSGIVAMK